MCGEPPTDREVADKILKAIKNKYGFIPLVNEVLSERPELFVPAANLGNAILEDEKRKALDKKTTYLCAVAAATAIGGEHCIGVQAKHAKAEGATREEVLEAMTIGSLMAMTRAQSYAFRKYKEIFDEE